MFETIDQNGVTNTHFDSITEWVEHIKIEIGHSWKYSTREAYEASLHSSIYSERIRKVASLLAGQIQMSMPDMQPNLDVTGLGFDVGLALSGVPECWVTIQPSKDPKVVKILYDFGLSAGTSEERMIQRGIAVCALITCLETAGISTEITLVGTRTDVYSHHNNYSYDGHYKIRFYIMFKKAGDYFDLDKFAWAMCDAKMYRALGCNWIETKTDCRTYAWLPVPEEGYDMFFKMIHLQDTDFSSPESTKEWVIGKCREFGVEITNPPLA